MNDKRGERGGVGLDFSPRPRRPPRHLRVGSAERVSAPARVTGRVSPRHTREKPLRRVPFVDSFEERDASEEIGQLCSAQRRAAIVEKLPCIRFAIGDVFRSPDVVQSSGAEALRLEDTVYLVVDRTVLLLCCLDFVGVKVIAN